MMFRKCKPPLKYGFCEAAAATLGRADCCYWGAWSSLIALLSPLALQFLCGSFFLESSRKWSVHWEWSQRAQNFLFKSLSGGKSLISGQDPSILILGAQWLWPPAIFYHWETRTHLISLFPLHGLFAWSRKCRAYWSDSSMSHISWFDSRALWKKGLVRRLAPSAVAVGGSHLFTTPSIPGTICCPMQIGSFGLGMGWSPL